jgi:hypothetical protein
MPTRTEEHRPFSTLSKNLLGRTLPPPADSFPAMARVTRNGAAGAVLTPYGVAVIDAPSVTWEPSVPRRRPRLWPAVAGLVITALVIAGGFAVLIAGLRVRYTDRTDKCAALDISPVARAFDKTLLKTFPDARSRDCLAAVGDSPQAPAAIVRVSVTFHRSTVEALLSYEASDEADAPGTVELPGGGRGRLLAEPPRPGAPCRIRAVLQDVNLTMTGQLTFDAGAGCDGHSAAAQALATSMRLTLAKLA